MTLKEAGQGKNLKIISVANDGGRLISLGMTKGAVVVKERSSPLGSSILVRIGRVRVVMRPDLAQSVEVQYV